MAEPPRESNDTALIADAVDIHHTQLPVTVGHGLDNSPLGKLPRELRDLIWVLVLVCSAGLDFNAWAQIVDAQLQLGSSSDHFAYCRQICARRTTPGKNCAQMLWALDIMATCQQIRYETKGLLLRLNDIHYRGDRALIRQKQTGILESIPMWKTIPSSLGTNLGRVILWPTSNYNSHDRAAQLSGWASMNVWQPLLSEFAEAVRPLRVFLGFRSPIMGWAEGEGQVCKLEAPVTFNDCSRIEAIVPAGDGPTALKIVNETIDKRLEKLQRHRTHRMCQVRAMLRKIESGLEESRQFMKEALILTMDVEEELTEVA